MKIPTAILLGLTVVAAPPTAPKPPGTLVDIGGQRLHVRCTGSGAPAIILENGLGDVSVIWALVQSAVGRFTRVCSYDRGGYAWSDPGAQPRSFAQLALELQTALDKLNVRAPYVVVGQSYGGLVVRGFAARHPGAVAGMVLVDAVHEDQPVIYGGQPHVLREEAKGRAFEMPRIQLNTAMLNRARQLPRRAPAGAIEAPLDRLPPAALAPVDLGTIGAAAGAGTKRRSRLVP